MPLKDKAKAHLRTAQAGKCAMCGAPMSRTNGASGLQAHDAETVEHVVPRSRGGPNYLGNIVLAHYRCNNAKNNAPPTPAEIHTLHEIMARMPRGFLIEEAERRLRSATTETGRPRAGAVSALNALRPFLSDEEMAAAFDRVFDKHAQRLRTVASAGVDAGAARQEAGAGNAGLAGVLRGVVFVLAGVLGAAWLGGLAAMGAGRDPASAAPGLALAALVHLALLFVLAGRPTRFGLKSVVAGCFVAAVTLSFLSATGSMFGEAAPIASLAAFAAPGELARSAALGAGALYAVGWVLLGFAFAVGQESEDKS